MFVCIAFTQYIISLFGCQGTSSDTAGGIRDLHGRSSGDGEIRTHDPLLARQVLSQLSYTPVLPFSNNKMGNGLKWTRTTDLTLIRRAL